METRFRLGRVDMKLELVAVPVADVDRAKAFYVDQVGFHLDHDHKVTDQLRFVQLTPPGSACSIVMGLGITEMAPGSQKGLQMVIQDAEAAKAELRGHGVQTRSWIGARSSSSATRTATPGLCSSSPRCETRRCPDPAADRRPTPA